MKIALINGSPKMKESSSEAILEELTPCFSKEVECKIFELHKSSLPEGVGEELNSFDALIFVFPLYVDGIPAHLLSCLCQLEDNGFKNKDIMVYGIVNCGFYEGHQCDIALEILKNWSNKVSLKWGGGIGCGCGGALVSVKSNPLGKGFKKEYGEAVFKLVEAATKKQQLGIINTSLGFPRVVYKFAGDAGWRAGIKKNGGKTKDLFKKF